MSTAITIGIRVIGPALGFLLGALCTRVYVDPLVDPGFDSSDPRWVGAWWLGKLSSHYIICLFVNDNFFFVFVNAYTIQDKLQEGKVFKNNYICNHMHTYRWNKYFINISSVRESNQRHIAQKLNRLVGSPSVLSNLYSHTNNYVSFIQKPDMVSLY